MLTTLRVCGEGLPSRILLNGELIEIQSEETGRLGAEIGPQLLERNKVELIWENEKESVGIHDGLASLSSVHLEILE